MRKLGEMGRREDGKNGAAVTGLTTAECHHKAAKVGKKSVKRKWAKVWENVLQMGKIRGTGGTVG